MNFSFVGHCAGKQVSMEFNDAREVARRDQAMMCHGIHLRREPCAVIPLARIWGVLVDFEVTNRTLGAYAVCG